MSYDIPKTFEEHFATKFPGGIEAFQALGGNAETILTFAREAWDAAIESKKPSCGVYIYKGYDVVPGDERWTLPDSVCNHHFATREQAVEWGQKLGYRIINA